MAGEAIKALWCSKARMRERASCTSNFAFLPSALVTREHHTVAMGLDETYLPMFSEGQI